MSNLLHLPAPLALCDDPIEISTPTAPNERTAVDLRAIFTSIGRFLHYRPSLSARVINSADRTTITRRF